MHKILTLNNISVKGLDRLPRDKYEVASEMARPDAILLRSFNMHDMELPQTLTAVARAGAGVNNIPVAKLSGLGIPVFNAPGANANAVKELVLAGMLLACRNICQGWDYARQLEGTEQEMHKKVEAGKKQFAGFELPGRTLGVVGLGAIGVQVANAAVALGMRVIGYDPTITVERAWQLSAEVDQAASVDELLARSDFVTLHVPLMDATRNMINRERLRSARERAVILNFARDGIVDDAAVLEAIDEERVYAYVTDFPSKELQRHPRVIALPHLGASTSEAEDNCAIMVAEQLRDYLENGNVKNAVNFPSVYLPRVGRSRVAIVNANRPDMVGQISHDLGTAGLNIIHMVNESKGDLAYTLIDVETEVTPEVQDTLAGIEGVLKVRVL
ncbi:MAG: 3-phosphoglycerate dehydrogenase family protein [Chromatiales bacterium]|jgi:D-3-phosphoglycerate dehydrogenase